MQVQNASERCMRRHAPRVCAVSDEAIYAHAQTQVMPIHTHTCPGMQMLVDKQSAHVQMMQAQARSAKAVHAHAHTRTRVHMYTHWHKCSRSMRKCKLTRAHPMQIAERSRAFTRAVRDPSTSQA